LALLSVDDNLNTTILIIAVWLVNFKMEVDIVLTVEIHGLGTENAAEVRGQILGIIFNIPWVDKDLSAVEICGNNIFGYNGRDRPQLRLLTSYSEMQNSSIVAELAVLKFPMHIISTKVHEGG